MGGVYSPPLSVPTTKFNFFVSLSLQKMSQLKWLPVLSYEAIIAYHNDRQT